MHRQVKNDELRLAYGLFVKRLAGKVTAVDGVPLLAEPSRGRSEPERLATQFISGEQQNLHGGHSITRGRKTFPLGTDAAHLNFGYHSGFATPERTADGHLRNKFVWHSRQIECRRPVV